MPVGTGRLSRWRRFAAALGVLALLSQTFVLVTHRPPSAMADGQAMAMTMAMGPDCPMVMDDRPAPPDPQDDADKAPRKAPPVCPICQSLQLSGLFVVPVHPVTMAALRVVVLLGSVPETRSRETATNERARSRAPPPDARSPTIDG